MALPVSPSSISLSQVAVELGAAANAGINLNQNNVRVLAGVSTTSGTRNSLNDLRGKSAYTPMSLVGNDDYRDYGYVGNVGGTAYAKPSVSVSGGSGGYTFSWVVTSTSGLSASFSNSSNQTCQLSRAYSRYSGGSFTVNLTCTVTDNTGHSVSVYNVVGSATCGDI